MDPAATFPPRSRLTTSLRGWLVLARASNLPTVWSNCIAACWLGGWNTWPAVLLLILSATLLYTGGMFLNDACDVAFDAEHKRDRPIIAGLTSRRSVAVSSVMLLLAGVLLLALIKVHAAAFGFALALAIVAYDFVHKRVAWAPWLMAMCRVLLYLTAASVGAIGITSRVLIFAAALGAYVVGVTYVARGESGPHRSANTWALFLVAPIAAALCTGLTGAVIFSAAALLLVIGRGLALIARAQIGRAVGLLLAGIVFVDLLAVAPRSLGLCLIFSAVFCLTLLSQRFVPAT